jgi:acetate---CoA ligase (ADP-forming)
VPLTDAEAGESLDRLRAGERLVDPRRSPPADRAGARAVIVRVGRFAEPLPGVVELDINPLVIRPGRGVAADLRIRVAPPPTAGPARRTPRI